MNTIIDKETKRALFLFGEERSITEEQGMLKIGAGEAQGEFFIGNPRAGKLTVVRGVEPPAEGWRPGKYFHTGKAWKADPKWVERPARPEKKVAAS